MRRLRWKVRDVWQRKPADLDGRTEIVLLHGSTQVIIAFDGTEVGWACVGYGGPRNIEAYLSLNPDLCGVRIYPEKGKTFRSYEEAAVAVASIAEAMLTPHDRICRCESHLHCSMHRVEVPDRGAWPRSGSNP